VWFGSINSSGLYDFFTVTLIGLKKCATLLPNYWLAETPQALALMRLRSQSAERDVKTKLIGTEGARLLREKRVYGRPRRRKPRRLPGPPAESEWLKWKPTSKLYKKTAGKPNKFVYSLESRNPHDSLT
jgi:hypothetical protein